MLIVFIAGLLAGFIAGKAITFGTVGTLRIDSSDPEGPFMFLELSKNPDILKSKKYVVLKVNLKK